MSQSAKENLITGAVEATKASRRAPLTSEERCRKAFEIEFAERIRHLKAVGRWDDETNLWLGWAACWKYLESRVTEFIQE